METMTDQIWYYEKDNQPWGPLYRAEIEILIRQGSIVPETPLWAEHLESWTPANEVEEFKCYFDLEAKSLITTGSHIHPWPRFFARMTGYIFFWGLILVVREFLPEDFTIINLSGFPAFVIYPAILTLASTPFEALIIRTEGNTIGQELFGIKITDSDGKRLSYNHALRRAIDVWVRGMGMGIPFVGFITMIMSYNNLKMHGTTAWDKKYGTIIVYSGVKYKKIAILVLIAAIFVIVNNCVMNIY